MKTIEARLDIEIFINCPKCNELIDLLNPGDTSGIDQNSDNELLCQILGDVDFNEFDCYDVTCSKCKTNFNVEGLTW